MEEQGNFIQTAFGGQNVMNFVFDYLETPDLLNARQVFTIWNEIASQRRFWRTVNIRNLHVSKYWQFVDFLKSKGTRVLDLRTMHNIPTLEEWEILVDALQVLKTLKRIHLCSCPWFVVECLAKAHPQLELIDAAKCFPYKIELKQLEYWKKMKELRIGSFYELSLNGLDVLKGFSHLTSLSLLSIHDLYKNDFSVIGELTNLKSLELGRCNKLPNTFVADTIVKLNQLERLALVYEGEHLHRGPFECMDLQPLSHLPNLKELLVYSLRGIINMTNFQFLTQMKRLKNLTLIPMVEFGNKSFNAIGELTDLEYLHLGTNSLFPVDFGRRILMNLKKLMQLRIQCGEGYYNIVEILKTIKDMKQLERVALINCNIENEFDKALSACKFIKQLMIVPKYESEVPRIFHIVLSSVSRMEKSLSHLVWGFPEEVLRFISRLMNRYKIQSSDGNNYKLRPFSQLPPLNSTDNLMLFSYQCHKYTACLSRYPLPHLEYEVSPLQLKRWGVSGLLEFFEKSLPNTRVKLVKTDIWTPFRQSIDDVYSNLHKSYC